MPVIENASVADALRAALRRLNGPYLLRHYDATPADFDEIGDEDLKCEYLDGVLIVHSPATVAHERLVTFLTILIGNYSARNALGEVFGSNVVMDLEGNYFSPDVSFLNHRQAERITGPRIVGPVDLAIEVLSKSTRTHDLHDKREAYRNGRVPEIWFVDAERRQFEADTLEGGKYTANSLPSGCWPSRVLPGFELDVSWLWSDPLPNPLECLKAGE